MTREQRRRDGVFLRVLEVLAAGGQRLGQDVDVGDQHDRQPLGGWIIEVVVH